jgi:hypothetical protein
MTWLPSIPSSHQINRLKRFRRYARSLFCPRENPSFRPKHPLWLSQNQWLSPFASLHPPLPELSNSRPLQTKLQSGVQRRI